MGSEDAVDARGRLEYQPALDGVRAIAVIAVLLFHAEVPGFDGGYLGVSVFFTLSGFLITSLLVREHASMGRVSLGAFYARRMRRLLPASALCLVAVIAIAAASDVFDSVSGLRAQAIGAALQIENWVLLAGDSSYQELFQRTGGVASPLEHFWSLSIEEQFYWVWPPVMFLALRSASRRGVTLVVGALTLAGALAAPLIAVVWGADAAYWATPARIGEILAGALLAVVVDRRAVPQLAAWLAPLGLAVIGVCVAMFPAAGGPAYRGMLPLFAVASAAVILGLQVDGPCKVALSVAPLVALGRISYGVYLYHWPIYVLLDERRTNLDGAWLVALRLATTLAVSYVSYELVEQPVRHARSRHAGITAIAGLATTAAVVLFAVAVLPSAVGSYWDVDASLADAAGIERDEAPLEVVTPRAPPTTIAPATPTPAPTTAPTATPTAETTSTTATSRTTPTTASTTIAAPVTLSRPVRIVVAGDSTAEATGVGLLAWAAEHPDRGQVELVPERGCGFLRGGERLTGAWEENPARCGEWIDVALPARVAELDPDVVMLTVTTWDVLDHRWDGGAGLDPLDDEFASRLRDDYAAVTRSMLDAGAGRVVWVVAPLPNVFWLNGTSGQEDPRRAAVALDAMRASVSVDPDRVTIVRLDEYAARADLLDDQDVRPDGVHWAPAASAAIADDFLGEALVSSAVSTTPNR